MDVPLPMRQMAYDRAIVVFSPEGRMYQVEYAKQAVEKAMTSVGICFNDGVVLVSNKISQKLMISDAVEKVSVVDEHIGVVSCGIIADCRILVDYARIRSQTNRITYNEPIEAGALVKQVSNRMQRFTQTGGIRPYGVSLLVAGIDVYPRLYEIDPSGTFREWKAHAIGRGSKKSNGYLESGYKPNMKKEDALKIGINALKEGEKISEDNVEIGILENNEFKVLSYEEVKQIMDKMI